MFKVGLIKKVIWLTIFMIGQNSFAQTSETINWLSFQQLNDSMKVKPKKVFVNFYASWCVFCKKMERTTFTDTALAKTFRDDFYAVKMNVETKDTIWFGEKFFVNKRANRVNPVHEIPLLMAKQKNKPFSLPAFVLLDENFTAVGRYFQFLSEEELVFLLHNSY